MDAARLLGRWCHPHKKQKQEQKKTQQPKTYKTHKAQSQVSHECDVVSILATTGDSQHQLFERHNPKSITCTQKWKITWPELPGKCSSLITYIWFSPSFFFPHSPSGAKSSHSSDSVGAGGSVESDLHTYLLLAFVYSFFAWQNCATAHTYNCVVHSPDTCGHGSKSQINITAIMSTPFKWLLRGLGFTRISIWLSALKRSWTASVPIQKKKENKGKKRKKAHPPNIFLTKISCFQNPPA